LKRPGPDAGCYTTEEENKEKKVVWYSYVYLLLKAVDYKLQIQSDTFADKVQCSGLVPASGQT
jgi:hypothetical protein